ncbi:MAG: rubrerythrin family protein [Micavibrio aeruginosavorus]|uniref:Rubrerythrin family protein n=1 Tax=Micavibrio aeruginosavorus TaxID=349221 RepID=A0A2W4ZYG1_9BACT|nr:MAG: rubrerythrin family protein [Micavibrio aeruginosavorus]
MGLPHWDMNEIDYSKIDRSKITPDLIMVVKAAALVEYNAVAYSSYLEKVFADDPQFQEMSRCWATEEVQHGQSLGKWAELVDPTWKLEEAMAKFREGYKIEHLNNEESIRGSRAGEMIARCMVETGTSSYYTAIGTSTDEPVLKEICAKIAGDEFRHYKLFYDTLNRYLKIEKMGRAKRLKIALGRIAESEDDELSYAFFAANANDNEQYDRKKWNREYMKRAYSYYQAPQVDRAVAMVFKACGFDPKGMGGKLASKAAWWLIQKNVKNAENTAKAA